jgi:thiol-disulfide isomerase/thioredoxin
MIPKLRHAWPASLVLALVAPGCRESSNTADSVPAPDVISAAPPKPAPTEEAKPQPAAPAEEAKPQAAAPASAETPAKTEEAKPTAVAKNLPADVFEAAPAKTDASATKEDAADDRIKLEPVKFDEFQARVAANKTAKFTLVDAWATWCVPCRENFPHLVEMNTKYADKGLAVISLSFDDLSNAKVVGEAKDFLREKKAVFTNFILDEADGVAFEKFDVNTIPAVFLYAPGGKLLKKYTLDDPNHQFTYEQVEKDVVALLDGKPLPKDEAPPAGK